MKKRNNSQFKKKAGKKSCLKMSITKDKLVKNLQLLKKVFLTILLKT